MTDRRGPQAKAEDRSDLTPAVTDADREAALAALDRVGPDDYVSDFVAEAIARARAEGAASERERVLREQRLTPDGWADFWELLDDARASRDGAMGDRKALLEELVTEHQFLGDVADVHVVWSSTEAMIRRRRADIYKAIARFSDAARKSGPSNLASNGRGESCPSNVVNE